MRRFSAFLALAACACSLLAACDDTITPTEQKDEPEPLVGIKYSIRAEDGILTDESSYARFVITVDADNEVADYTIKYSVDSEASVTLSKIWPGTTKEIKVESREEGEHVIRGAVKSEKTGETLSFNVSAWMRYPEVTGVTGVVKTVKKDYPVSSTPLVFDKDEQLVLEVNYTPASTKVKAVAYNGKDVELKRLGEPADGSVSMEAVPTAKNGDTWIGLILVNGEKRDTVCQKFSCTGEEAKDQKVTDFSVTGFDSAGDITIPMKSSVSFTVTPIPAKALDAGEVSVSIGDEAVAKVSPSGDGYTITSVYPGQTVLTVKVGSVTKTWNVAVTGKPVTDFIVSTDFLVREWHVGDRVEASIEPSPIDAFDTDEMEVTSLNPGVVTVSKGSSLFRYVLTAKTYGSATVEVKTKHCRKTFDVKVLQDISLAGIENRTIAWGESVSFTPEGHYNDFFLVGSLDPDVKMERSGNTITLTSNLHKSTTANKRYDKEVTLTLKTGDGQQKSAKFKLGAVSNTLTFRVTTKVTGSSTEFTFRFKNGHTETDYYEKMQGYIFSSAAASLYMNDFYIMLSQGKFGIDGMYGNTLYARYVNFAQKFTGMLLDEPVVIPGMEITEMKFTINATGDDVGSYDGYVNGYILANKGIDKLSEETWIW